MKILDLRNIGRKLMGEISALRGAQDLNKSSGFGAAGDRTFPIDSRAEDIIISGLRALKEPLTVVSEEIGFIDIRGGGRRVIIDPVDGSKNAISGIPFFCSSIAVADGDTLGDVYLSYIIDLTSGDEFWAETMSGAFLNGRRIHTQEDDIFYLIAYEAQNPARDIPKIVPLLSQAHKARCLGAIALDLAYLSRGSVSVFVSPSPSRSFDFAGGWLMVKEAGGKITSINGDSVDATALDLKRNAPVLASGNRILHEKALGFLSGKG